MNLEQTLEAANAAVFARFGRHLSDVETAILTGAWQSQTYEQIAEASGYSISYLTRDVGPKLWKLLGQALGEAVSKTSFQAALERQGHKEAAEKLLPAQTQERSPPPRSESGKALHMRADWGEAVDVRLFYGRTVELATLSQWICEDRCRLVALLGMGGIGKTALAVKLAQQIQENFEAVIWRSLRNAPLLETLLGDLVPFLSNQQDTKAELGRLLHWLRTSRCLVILDNGETILQAGDYVGQYRPGYENYADFFRVVAETAHQSCLILTSREKPTEIAALEGIDSAVHSLQLRGSAEVAQALIQAKRLSGSAAQKQELVERYGCNSLALKIVATSIQDLFDGEIGQFLEQNAVIFNSVRRLLAQQFERLSQLEQTIMYWLAINREWTTITELAEEIIPTVPRVSLLEALESLRWRSLIEKRAGSYTQQPVVMEYVTDCLIERVVDELVTTKLSLFASHALIKTTVKDYIRESQARLVLEPIANKLRTILGYPQALEHQLQDILGLLQGEANLASSYGSGNLINLCDHLEIDLTGYDFSNLTIRHAYLQKVSLHQVNFAHTVLAQSVFKHPFSAIFAVAFSPDNKLLAIVEASNEIRIWRVADSQPLLICRGNTNWVWSVAWNPDGTLLASGGGDCTIRLWDAHTGQLLRTLEQNSQVRSVVWSPDGTLLASGDDDCLVRLWNTSTGKLLSTLQGHRNWVWSVAWNPDGTLLASGGGDCTIRLWDTRTGQLLRTLEQTNEVRSVAWSPDGTFLASGSGDGTVKLWDHQLRAELEEPKSKEPMNNPSPESPGYSLTTFLGHSREVWSVAWHPNSSLLASGSGDCTVKLWDVSTGQLLRTLPGHTDWVRSVAWSPDGTLLASGSGDCTVRLWDTSASQALRVLQGYTSWIWSVAWSPDGTLLASGSTDCTVKLWDVGKIPVEPEQLESGFTTNLGSKGTTEKLWKTLPGHTSWVASVAWHPYSSLLASGSGDGTVKLWDISATQLLKTLQGHSSWVWSVAWSPDGTLLATGSYDHTVKLWDVSTGQLLRTLQGHTNWLRSVAWSPDGTLLATGSSDHTVKLWHVRTGQLLRTLPESTKEVWSVAWSPDSTLLAGSSSDYIRIWNVRTGQLLKTLQGHTGWIWSVAWSPEGTLLASASFDQTVRLWNVATGQELKILQGHRDWVRSVTWSPDGRTLASGSTDETIKLWNANTGQCLATFRAARPYEGMNITGVRGLTEGQVVSLKALGAVDEEQSSTNATRSLPPLVGRGSEWAAVQSWMTAAGNTVSEILLLIGEPGIGKTRLLEALEEKVRAANGHVLWGRGFAAEMVRPYGAWIDALRSVAPNWTPDLPSGLGSLIPEASSTPADSMDRSRLFDAVVQLLLQLAANGITVVMLDDIQWLDEASIALLHYAARLLSRSPVLFACAARDRELEDNTSASKFVQGLRREQRLRQIELAPLDREQTIELVRSQDASIDGNRVFTDSGGNPLFALEVARALLHHRQFLMGEPPKTGLPQETPRSTDLEVLIQDRLLQLDETVRELLPWAATLGHSFNPTTIARVVDCSQTQLLTAMEQLERHGIIRPSTSLNGEIRYDFAHDIVRQIAYRQQSEPRRRLIHLQIAHVLEKLSAADDSLASNVAHHAAMGGDRELAASASLVAAERCLRLFAYAEAAELAQRGIQYCQSLNDCLRIRLHVALLRVYVIAGVTRDCLPQLEAELHQLIVQASALGLKDEEAIALEALIALNHDHGNLPGVQEHSLRAAERGRAASPTTTARILAYTGWCLAEIEREMSRAEALLLEAQSLAARVGLELMDIFSGLGIVRYYHADSPGARLLLEQAWRMAQVEQDHWRECIALKYLAMLELEGGDPTAALAYSRELAIVAARMGDEGSEGPWADALNSLAQYALSQVGAEDTLEQALSTLRQIDDQRMLAYTLILAAEIDLAKGRVEPAIARAKVALPAAQVVDYPSGIALAWAAMVRGALALGNHQCAVERFQDLQHQIANRALSARARTVIDDLAQQLAGITESGGEHGSHTRRKNF